MARIEAVLLMLLGAAPLRAEESAAANFSTVVRADAPGRGPLATTVRTDEARTLPGVSSDGLRAVEAAAGVVRPQLGAGQLIVWGAAPSESRVYLDGIEVPALYHLGGLRAILPTAAIASLTLLPAGYGAEWGRALGGLVQLDSRTLPDGVHGELSADLLDVGAHLSTALGPRLKVMAAGRYSYVERALSTLAGEQVSDFFPLPRYFDFQTRAVLTLRQTRDVVERLSALVFGSGDEQRRTQVLADSATAHSELWRRSFYRFGLDYQRKSQGGSDVRVTPWLGIDDSAYEARFGETPATQSRHELRYGLRATTTVSPLRRLTLLTGIDVLGSLSTLTRAGTLTRPPREGDRAVFGQSPSREQNTDDWSAHQGDYSVFASLVLRLGRVRIESGLRAVATLLDTSRLLPRIGASPPLGFRRIDFSVEPRLLLRVQPLARLSLWAAAGLYHQPPDAADRSAVFGNPTLGPARAIHAVLGSELLVKGPLRIELAGYFRALDKLWARSPLTSPPLARSLTQEGSGRSYGGLVVVRLTPWRQLSGFVSYSWSRSERRDAESLPLRLADFDQPHQLQLAARYVLFGFGIGVRLRYTSGLPRTEVVAAFYDARDDQFQPQFGPHNGIRLPDFVQLDAQLDRSFQLGPRLSLAVSLEVQNVTNQHNAEELAYRFDFSQREYIRGLPTLAVLGVRLSF